jgi:hypothetical protein
MAVVILRRRLGASAGPSGFGGPKRKRPGRGRPGRSRWARGYQAWKAPPSWQAAAQPFTGVVVQPTTVDVDTVFAPFTCVVRAVPVTAVAVYPVPWQVVHVTELWFDCTAGCCPVVGFDW